MKKFFAVLLFALFLIYGYLYINKVNNNINVDYSFFKNTDLKVASLTNYYVYGNHLGLEGIIDDDVDPLNLSLILKNDDDEIKLDCFFEKYDDGIRFYTSKLINDGINLDLINIGNYYLFIKFDDGNLVRYYSLKNITDYKDIEYYSLTKNNKNNKINITFNSKEFDDRVVDYILFDVNESLIPKNVYDITIDPGHGGIDSGSVYKYNGILYKESFFTLDIAIRLKNILEKKGYKVLLTRDDDIDLDYYGDSGRATLPNKYGSKLCLSLHLNSDKSNMSYGGVEVYTPNDVD